MGNIPGADYEFGNQCVKCFGEVPFIDKGTGWLNTPKYVNLTFSGILLCPGASFDPNKTFLCEQSTDCVWLGFDSNLEVGFTIAEFDGFSWTAYAACQARFVPQFYFVGGGDACQTIFENDQDIGDCPVSNGGYNGIATVEWGPGIGP